MKSLREIFFLTIEEFNHTLTHSLNKEWAAKKLSVKEVRGVLFTTLRRNLGAHYAHYTNFRNLPVECIYMKQREDGTLERMWIDCDDRAKWWTDDVTYETRSQLKHLANEFEELGKNREQMELCAIVNSIKNYKL